MGQVTRSEHRVVRQDQIAPFRLVETVDEGLSALDRGPATDQDAVHVEQEVLLCHAGTVLPLVHRSEFARGKLSW